MSSVVRHIQVGSSNEAERREHFELALGRGQCVLNWGTHDGAPAIFIEPAPLPKEPGTQEAETPGLRRDCVARGSLVIVFEGGTANANQSASEALRATLRDLEVHVISKQG